MKQYVYKMICWNNQLYDQIYYLVYFLNTRLSENFLPHIHFMAEISVLNWIASFKMCAAQ